MSKRKTVEHYSSSDEEENQTGDEINENEIEHAIQNFNLSESMIKSGWELLPSPKPAKNRAIIYLYGVRVQNKVKKKQSFFLPGD